MQNTIIDENIKIENLIYEIRGKQVMLASDVAKLYNSETKIINQVVKRNINRFPEDFCFQLTKEEYYNILRSQSVTLELKQGQYSKYLPYVFTEHGIMMLSGLLKSDIAAKVNVLIIKAFVSMKKYLSDNKDIFRRLTTVEYEMIECKDKIDELFNKLEPKKIEKQKIFFNGEIYDSYSLIIDLLKEANNRIIIIDNYIDKSILDMLIYKKEQVTVELVTSSHYLTKLDINKFNYKIC